MRLVINFGHDDTVDENGNEVHCDEDKRSDNKIVCDINDSYEREKNNNFSS